MSSSEETSEETSTTMTTGIPMDVQDVEIDGLYLTIVIILTLVAFFGNLGTISAFLTDSKVNTKPSDLILLNLACVDFAVSIFVMPLGLIVEGILGRYPLGEIGCRITVPIDMTLLTAGIMSVLLISFDRYQMLALDYSKYVKKWGQKQVKRLIAVTWVVSLLPGVFETVTWNTTLDVLPQQMRPNFDVSCSQPSSWRIITNVVCVIFVAILPTAVVSVLGVLIIFKLHQRLQQWRKVGYADVGSTAGSTAGTISKAISQVGEEGTATKTDSNGQRNGKTKSEKTNPNDLIRKRYIKPIVTYLSLSLCIAICTFPVCIYAMFLSSDLKYYDPLLLKYLVCLLYSASCWNPILYGLTNSKIRDFYKRRIRSLSKMF